MEEVDYYFHHMEEVIEEDKYQIILQEEVPECKRIVKHVAVIARIDIVVEDLVTVAVQLLQEDQDNMMIIVSA